MENAVLDDRDAAAVLEVIGSVADARTVDEYADLAMKGLFELIECIDVSYNEMNRVESRVAWKTLPDQGELLTQFAPVFERYMRQNPLVAHFEDTGDTRAMMWSDFASLDRADGVERRRLRHRRRAGGDQRPSARDALNRSVVRNLRSGVSAETLEPEPNLAAAFEAHEPGNRCQMRAEFSRTSMETTLAAIAAHVDATAGRVDS